jgi:hypothetical protein
MEDLHKAGGCDHDAARAEAAAEPRCAHRHRPHAGREIDAAPPGLGPEGGAHRSTTRSTRRRHRGAARQPRAQRRDHQAVGGAAPLLQHEGRAVVFDSLEDLANRIDDPAWT